MAISLAAPLYPCTFGLLAGEIILDPCAEEEALLSTSLTLMLDSDGEMRTFHKPGGAPLPESAMQACYTAAQQRLPALSALVGGSGTSRAAQMSVG